MILPQQNLNIIMSKTYLFKLQAAIIQVLPVWWANSDTSIFLSL